MALLTSKLDRLSEQMETTWKDLEHIHLLYNHHGAMADRRMTKFYTIFVLAVCFKLPKQTSKPFGFDQILF